MYVPDSRLRYRVKCGRRQHSKSFISAIPVIKLVKRLCQGPAGVSKLQIVWLTWLYTASRCCVAVRD